MPKSTYLHTKKKVTKIIFGQICTTIPGHNWTCVLLCPHTASHAVSWRTGASMFGLSWLSLDFNCVVLSCFTHFHGTIFTKAQQKSLHWKLAVGEKSFVTLGIKPMSVLCLAFGRNALPPELSCPVYFIVWHLELCTVFGNKQTNWSVIVLSGAVKAWPLKLYFTSFVEIFLFISVLILCCPFPKLIKGNIKENRKFCIWFKKKIWFNVFMSFCLFCYLVWID